MDNAAISIIALVLVFAILIFFAVWGYHKGFLRHILTTMSFVITIVIAGVLAPRVSTLLQDSSIGQNTKESIGGYVTQTMGSPIIESSKEIQDQIIDNLPLPSTLQKDLAENNTAEEYVELQVNGFTDYLSTRLSGMVINIVTYLILLAAVYILIRVLLRLFKVLNHVPLIGGINRLLGGLVGLLEGFLVIWVLCLIIMALAGTDFGRKVLEVIHENDVLTFIYDHNGILIGANALFHTFL